MKHDKQKIFFVGQAGFDRKVAWARKNAGMIDRVAQGVYIDANLSEEQKLEVLQSHACRIANYIYGEAVLSGPSAVHFGAVNGVVSVVSGYRRPIKKLAQGFELHVSTIETDGEPIPCDTVRIKDQLGDISVKVLTDEMLILSEMPQVKGVRQEHRQNMSIPDLSRVVERSVARSGSPQALKDRLGYTAKKVGLEDRLPRANEYVDRMFHYSKQHKPIVDCDVFWMARRIARITFDGIGWQFGYEHGFSLPITFSKTTAANGNVPRFFESILPEPLRGNEKEEVTLSFIEKGERYISNFAIRQAGAPRDLIIDTLEGSIQSFTDQHGIFTGKCDIKRGGGGVLRELSKIPAISGQQLKIPVNLSKNGVITPAIGKSFTHILKPKPNEMLNLAPVMEWYGLLLAYFAGVKTENFALVDTPNLGKAFLAERFDIRASDSSAEAYLTEDFCSMLGLRSVEKNDADMTEVAEALMEYSTSREEDARSLFRQTLVSWLIVNSDMHLKNMMVIKKPNEDLTGFSEVRLSPAYDMVCTSVFPSLPIEAALPMMGEQIYTPLLMEEFAKKHLKLNKGQVHQIYQEVIERLEKVIPMIRANLPDCVTTDPDAMYGIAEASNWVSARIGEFLDNLRNKVRVVRYNNNIDDEFPSQRPRFS